MKTPWQKKWLGLQVTALCVQTLADEAERFAGRWYRNYPERTLLVVYGASGTGKSHTANCVYQFAKHAAFSAWEAGHWKGQIPSIGFYRWPEVTDAFKSGQYGTIDDAVGFSLVIIDDLGAEHDPSRHAADKLCQILSRREHRFTFVTTNIQPLAWAERFDARIADRLMRNSVVVDMSAAQSFALK